MTTPTLTQKKLFQTPTKAQNRQRAIAWALRVVTGGLGQLKPLRSRLTDEELANMDNVTAAYFTQLIAEVDRLEIQLEKLKRAALAANFRVSGQALLEKEEKIAVKTQDKA